MRIIQESAAEPWGLTEMQIEDPDGIRIVLVEVPAGHPLHPDPRSALPLRLPTACRMTRASAAAWCSPCRRQMSTRSPDVQENRISTSVILLS